MRGQTSTDQNCAGYSGASLRVGMRLCTSVPRLDALTEASGSGAVRHQETPVARCRDLTPLIAAGTSRHRLHNNEDLTLYFLCSKDSQSKSRKSGTR